MSATDGAAEHATYGEVLDALSEFPNDPGTVLARSVRQRRFLDVRAGADVCVHRVHASGFQLDQNLGRTDTVFGNESGFFISLVATLHEGR